MANVAKSKAMTFHPGAIRYGMPKDAVGKRCTGRGDTYRGRLRQRISCYDCGMELIAGLMTAQRQHMRETDPDINWNRLPVSKTEHIP